MTLQKHKRKLEGKSSVPISLDKFKVFFCKMLRDSRAFVDSYWSKIRRDFQYQQEEVQDWAAYLEHLQAVLNEFDLKSAPNKTNPICYFQKELRLSIQA